MKVREDFTLGRLQVGVCGLPHPRPMFLALLKHSVPLPRKTTDTSSLCLRQIKEVTRACCMMGHRLWPRVDLRSALLRYLERDFMTRLHLTPIHTIGSPTRLPVTTG